MSDLLVVLRGGGDLASGVAYRLHRAGISVLVTELPQPLVVRRKVAFAEAVYQGRITVEGITGVLAPDIHTAFQILENGDIPVVVDADLRGVEDIHRSFPGIHLVLVDGRMRKRQPSAEIPPVDLFIGLGPGFVAGMNCHAAVETNRGHLLGRVLWRGEPEQDTGIPESVKGYDVARVVRAPVDGELVAHTRIGDHIESGQPVAEVSGQPARAAISGVLRGIMHDGLWVQKGMKIADVDPRDDPSYCELISDKSLAIGGGVLEAILSRKDLRPFLWK